MSGRMRGAAVAGALVAQLALPALTLAHETRQVGDYQFVVGFIGEPVYTNQESGLEIQVTRGEEPVGGLEESLEAEVIFQGQTRAQAADVFAYRRVDHREKRSDDRIIAGQMAFGLRAAA